MSEAASQAAPGRFFQHCVLRDFLAPELVQALLDHAQANQAQFEPTQVYEGGIKPEVRVSLGLRDLGVCKKPFKDRLRAVEPELRARLGLDPYTLKGIETELVAHNDGAFYRSHIDTRTGEKTWSSLRVISGVYYFHNQPKAFAGGALRLHALFGDDVMDIEPLHNSLLAFPSFAPHEVMPVSCPSQAFMDSRFAINCWFRKVGMNKA